MNIIAILGQNTVEYDAFWSENLQDMLNESIEGFFLGVTRDANALMVIANDGTMWAQTMSAAISQGHAISIGRVKTSTAISEALMGGNALYNIIDKYGFSMRASELVNNKGYVPRSKSDNYVYLMELPSGRIAPFYGNVSPDTSIYPLKLKIDGNNAIFCYSLGISSDDVDFVNKNIQHVAGIKLGSMSMPPLKINSAVKDKPDPELNKFWNRLSKNTSIQEKLF